MWKEVLNSTGIEHLATKLELDMKADTKKVSDLAKELDAVHQESYYGLQEKVSQKEFDSVILYHQDQITDNYKEFDTRIDDNTAIVSKHKGFLPPGT